MELLLAGLVIIVSLLLAAKHEKEAPKQAPVRRAVAAKRNTPTNYPKRPF